MKVAIDILSPKHLWFFLSVERRLKERGIRVFMTSRRYEQLTPLVRALGRGDIVEVGEYGGGTLYGKLKASSERLARLADLVSEHQPDLTLSGGSPEMARVSYGLSIPHFMQSDTPYSPVHPLCLPLTGRLFSPWIIPVSKWTRYGIRRRKIKRYRAIDPVAWLRDFKPSKKALGEHGLEEEKYVLVRLPETQASYLMGESLEKSLALVRKLTNNVKGFKIAVMARYEDQVRALKELKGVTVVDKPLLGQSIIYYSALFVGGGGTTTEEAALLGVPTISFYPGKMRVFPDYLTFLMRRKMVSHHRSLRGLVREAMRLLASYEDAREMQEKRAKRLWERMEDPSNVVAEGLARFLKERER